MTSEALGLPLSKRDLISRLVPPQLFNEGAVASMEQLLKDEEFVEGQRIIVQGERGDKMYFNAQGFVEIISRGAFGMGQPQRLAVLGPGDIFGEIALALNRPRTADVVAITSVKAFSLSRDDWQYVKAFYPPFAYRIEEIAKTRAGINR